MYRKYIRVSTVFIIIIGLYWARDLDTFRYISWLLYWVLRLVKVMYRKYIIVSNAFIIIGLVYWEGMWICSTISLVILLKYIGCYG